LNFRAGCIPSSFCASAALRLVEGIEEVETEA
jgi:hypothetical protein